MVAEFIRCSRDSKDSKGQTIDSGEVLGNFRENSIHVMVRMGGRSQAQKNK